MANRASLKDIAIKVGVSTALVSYVINGKEKGLKINQDLVKKIKETAMELNYQPNEIARSLRKGSTKTIGLVVADISNPFFAHLSRAIENEAINFGYTVIIGSSDEVVTKSEMLLNTLISRQVDGFIIAPAEGTEHQIKDINEKNIPMVLIDRYFPEINTNFVITDNYLSTYEDRICDLQIIIDAF
jgi:LacI family transcriptional regulator